MTFDFNYSENCLPIRIVKTIFVPLCTRTQGSSVNSAAYVCVCVSTEKARVVCTVF